jgi:hypothetical protein
LSAVPENSTMVELIDGSGTTVIVFVPVAFIPQSFVIETVYTDVEVGATINEPLVTVVPTPELQVYEVPPLADNVALPPAHIVISSAANPELSSAEIVTSEAVEASTVITRVTTDSHPFAEVIDAVNVVFEVTFERTSELFVATEQLTPPDEVHE